MIFKIRMLLRNWEVHVQIFHVSKQRICSDVHMLGWFLRGKLEYLIEIKIHKEIIVSEITNIIIGICWCLEMSGHKRLKINVCFKQNMIDISALSFSKFFADLPRYVQLPSKSPNPTQNASTIPFAIETTKWPSSFWHRRSSASILNRDSIGTGTFDSSFHSSVFKSQVIKMTHRNLRGGGSIVYFLT